MPLGGGGGGISAIEHEPKLSALHAVCLRMRCLMLLAWLPRSTVAVSCMLPVYTAEDI